MRITTLLMALLYAAGLPAACIRKSLPTPNVQTPNSIPPTQSPPNLGGGVLPTHFGLLGVFPANARSPLGQKFADISLHDVFVSLAVCECLPQLQAKLITSLNANRGALPQALIPAVRSEILSNPQLKILDIVPRPFDDFVGGLFADEQKVATEISEGLRKKIKIAEPSWVQENETLALQLDGFTPLPGTLAAASGRTVRMVDVWARWSLLLSQGGPWSSTRSQNKDAGLLWHELLRSLAEGEYLFGLAGTSDGNSWGGLTIPIDLQITNPGPFDPRTRYNQVRFLTGQLDLTLSSNNSLSLARFGGDRWTWRAASVPLVEQALQWWVSARLLNRLRPFQRGAFSAYFPNLIPNDSYQLSLLILPALDALLSGRFIDENSRAIRSYLSGAQVSGVAQSIREKADPQTLSLLLLAMSHWIQELSAVTDLSVSAETSAQLQSAPAALLRGAQLIVQTLLGETLAPRLVGVDASGETPYSVYANANAREQGELSLRDHAQVLHALVLAEQKLMPSPYLRGRSHQLATGLLQRWKELQTFDPQKDPLSNIIWLKIAAELYINSNPESAVSKSFAPLLTQVNSWLQTFEESALQ